MKERDSSMRNKILAYAVCAVCLSATPSIQAITAYAAEQQSNLPYSRFWETQPDGSWKYKYDNGTYATGWILDEVDGNWYYMDSSGIMQSGLYKSYDRYYFFSEEHDGHFGHMLVNGEVYQGVTISADTSETYRGALSQETISQLGLDVTKAIDITGTQHVSGGEVVTKPSTNTSSGDTSWKDEEQAIKDQYFGGGGVGGTTGDHPLSNNGARPGIEGWADPGSPTDWN